MSRAPVDELAALEIELAAKNQAHHNEVEPLRQRIGELIDAERRWWRISDHLAVEIVPGTHEVLRVGHELYKHSHGRGYYVSGNVHLLSLAPEWLRALAEVRALVIAYESKAWDLPLPESGEWLTALAAIVAAKGEAWFDEVILGDMHVGD